jgi:hypothetical protein
MSSPFRALRTSSPSVEVSDNLFDTVLQYRVEGTKCDPPVGSEF